MVDDVYLFEIANGIFPAFDLLEQKYKCTGLRLVSLREKLRQFPKSGNRVMILSLRSNHLNWLEAYELVHYILLDCMHRLAGTCFRRNIFLVCRAAFVRKPWRHGMSIYVFQPIINHTSVSFFMLTKLLRQTKWVMCASGMIHLWACSVQKQ
jgi:hypothetical protein